MRFPLLRLTGVFALAIGVTSCSDDGLLSPTPRAAYNVTGSALPPLVITEVMADPSKVADASGEWFEIYNGGETSVDLNGWRIKSGPTGSETHTVNTSVVVPARGYVVLGNNLNSATNGGVTLAYSYAGGITLNNSNTDWLVLSTPAGALVDSVAYSASTVSGTTRTITTPAHSPSAGVSRVVLDAAADNTIMAGANWQATPTGTTYGLGDRGTPGAGSYGPVTNEPAGPVTTVTIGAAQVVVGATRQITAAATDSEGRTATTTYTWASSDPAVARIDAATGIATGVAEGTVTVTATSANGVVGTGTLQVTVPGGVASISISVNSPFSVPAGYTKPAFPTARDAEGKTIFPAPKYTWTSSDAAIATVDSLGYITGVSAGRVTVRAIAANGVSGGVSIDILPAEAPTTAIYRNHLEFGAPAGGTAGILQEKSQFAASYNPVRGGPNWVSWNLNASQFGAAPRCDCFSADQTLPAGVTRIVDFDYRNGGYDRGHMVQSESRTTTNQENASTFLLTNILPQAGENNQGPWSQFEQYLNGLARTDGKEVYMIAGGLYAESAPTIKNEGKVAIPDYTWKVAVVMDGGEGAANVTSTGDVQVFAIKMPNLTTPGVPASAVGMRNNPWQQYEVTVDQIERETGYDLLSKLPNQVEVLVESGTRAPVASAGGTYTVAEGTAVAFDASASTDPDGDALTYAWDFGDGTTGTGVKPQHAYADNGVYQAKVTVTDAVGAEDVATASVTVVNVAPTVHVFAGATLLAGESFTGSTRFADPGADEWTATADYGDGAGAQPVSISGREIQLSHTYTRAGSFTVTVTVRDKDGDAGTQTARVTVQTPSQGIDGLDALVSTLARTGSLNRGNANALSAKLRAASASLARGDEMPAMNQLEAFVNQVEALAGHDRLTAAEAKGMIDAANRILRSIRG